MQFNSTGLDGAWLIEPTAQRDERGSFARTFCAETFGDRGLETGFPQHSVSVSTRRGTLRGLHFQRAPHQEVKLVRCIAGAIFDVIVDLRPESSTFGQWQGFELTGANGRQLYIPKGFAHGFQTLVDEAAIQYLISTPYAPDAASGVRFDDPRLAIAWPLPPTVLSDRDRSWPNIA